MSGPTPLSDLEDGEIEDSDNGPTASTVIDNPNVSTKQITPQVPQQPYTMQARPSGDAGYRSSRNACFDSSGDSSSDEQDEDLYDESPKKNKMQRMEINTMDTLTGSAAHGDAFSRAAEKFQSKKLWKEVVYEQTLNDTMLKVNTTEKTNDADDRGVESYDFTNKYERTELTNYEDDFLGGDLYGDSNIDMDKDDLSEEEEEKVVDIGDMETFGTTSESKSRKRTIKDRLGKRNSPSRDKKSVKDRLGSKSDSRSNSPNRGNVKQRLGKRHFNRDQTLPFLSKARFNLQSKEDDPPEKVSADLLQALGEPEFQLELFFRVVNTLGVKKSLEIYYETESIEENGGMVIVSGDRRRSPGGVFLQLVKSDKDTTKEMAKIIFPDMNKKRFKKKKKSKKHRDMDTGEGKDYPSKIEAYLKERSAKDSAKASEMEAEEDPDDSRDGQKDPDNEDVDLDEDNCIGIELDFPETS